LRPRAPHNPLEDMAGLQHEGQEEKGRRAFELDEMRTLLERTTQGKIERFGMTAEDRVRLYHFAYETGIRPGQIRKLTAGNFDLDAEPPLVVTRAQHVKRRTRHEQVLTAGMVKLLRPQLAKKLPGALLFPTMPDKYTLAEMLRADLADARAAWIAAAGTDAKEAERRQRSDYLAAPRPARGFLQPPPHARAHARLRRPLADGHRRQPSPHPHGHDRPLHAGADPRPTADGEQPARRAADDAARDRHRGSRGRRLRQNCAKPAEFGGLRRG
jgi:hypothetical protein